MNNYDIDKVVQRSVCQRNIKGGVENSQRKQVASGKFKRTIKLHIRLAKISLNIVTIVDGLVPKISNEILTNPNNVLI